MNQQFDQLPNAADARRQVQQGQYQKAQQQLQQICLAINGAVADGKFCVSFEDTVIEPTNKTILETKGYMIQSNNYRNEFSTTISW